MAEQPDAQARDWKRLYTRIDSFMAQFGTPGALGNADYWVLDDNWGGVQQKVFVNNLTMLEPRIVMGLQRLLSDFPGWVIMMAVSLRGSAEEWPDMGLTIRRNEIVDGLRARTSLSRFATYVMGEVDRAQIATETKAYGLRLP